MVAAVSGITNDSNKVVTKRGPCENIVTIHDYYLQKLPFLLWWPEKRSMLSTAKSKAVGITLARRTFCGAGCIYALRYKRCAFVTHCENAWLGNQPRLSLFSTFGLCNPIYQECLGRNPFPRYTEPIIKLRFRGLPDEGSPPPRQATPLRLT